MVLSNFPNTTYTHVILSPLIWDVTLIIRVHVSHGPFVCACVVPALLIPWRLVGGVSFVLLLQDFPNRVNFRVAVSLKHPVGILIGIALT